MAIIETKKIVDVLQYSDSETLVLFDIDNTLIEPVGTLGSVTWFDYICEKFQNNGVELAEAIQKTYQLWMPLQYMIEVKPVEKETAFVVKQLQGKNITTMGLTARGFDLSERTIEQLKSVNISFCRWNHSTIKNTIYDRQELILDVGTGFYKGVLSIEPGGDKGKRLISFFDCINYLPKKVLFIDDCRMYLDSVAEVMIRKNILFKGLHYSGAITPTIKFDPVKIDKELQLLFNGTEHQKLLESIA